MIKKRGTDKLDSVVLNQHRALSPPNQQFYRDGHLLVDLRDRVVMLDSQILTLTRTEYRLLALYVHLRRLRKKLGVYADQYIETVCGTGYRFRPVPGP